MFRDTFRGKPEQLKDHVEHLVLPDSIPAHDAVRAFIRANIPTYGVARWQLSVSCESESNQGGDRISGFISVAVMEV